MEKPWDDWPDTDIEAGWWVKNEAIYFGYLTGKFHPGEEVAPLHFVTVMRRAGITVEWPEVVPVTVGDALKYLPNTAYSSLPTDKLTRYRLAVMLYRYIQEPIDKIDKWFKETNVTWNGVTRQPRLIGYADVVFDLSREYNVPIWLALGQCWRESQWFTTGLSIDYNCGWGLKDSKKRWGVFGNPEFVGKGFANYASVGEAIHAYFRLMDSPIMPYRALIDQYLATGDMTYISQALDIYAPGNENDIIQHHKIVRTVKDWCDQRGIK